MLTPVRPPWLLRRYYRNFTWHLPGDSQKVYLTFDDGPVPDVTDFVLDTLGKYNFKATFFCIGKNVKSHPEIYQRILDSGHRTGNHTFLHSNGWLTRTELYLKDVSDAALHIQSDLFRPPYGRIKKSQAEILTKQFRVIMWDVLSFDYDPAVSPRQCLRNVTVHTRPGSIIVFHDSIKAFPNLKETLPAFLAFLKEKNFVPDIIS